MKWTSQIALAFSVVTLSMGAAWSAWASPQQPITPSAGPPPEPPLAQVMELDADERVIFFDQRLKLHCNVCHTAEMIEQQRLTLAQWQAEVQKMIGWGATLPKDYAGPMAEHLAKRYPPENRVQPATISPAEIHQLSAQTDQTPVAATEADHPATFQRFLAQCANCHGADARGNEIGPRLTERPILTRPEDFAAHLQEGRGRMPAFQKTMAAEDLQAIRRWLLGRSESWRQSP